MVAFKSSESIYEAVLFIKKLLKDKSLTASKHIREDRDWERKVK